MLYDTTEMQTIRDKVEAKLSSSGFIGIEFVINRQDVADAISKPNAHKSGGNLCLSTDHFLNADADLHLHISFLLTSIIVHGSGLHEFVSSTVISIPKKVNFNSTQSDNFRGIALSSCFCKIPDNIIMVQSTYTLNTSDLQFGFKRITAQHICVLWYSKKHYYVIRVIILLLFVRFWMPRKLLIVLITAKFFVYSLSEGCLRPSLEFYLSCRLIPSIVFGLRGMVLPLIIFL
jgi:hypothetical protein